MVTVLQRRVAPPIAALIAAVLATSIVAAVDARSGGDLYHRLALMPSAVWHGQLWRLVTWTLVEPGPISLITICVGIWWFGGDLASVWGTRRFLRFVASVVLVASVGTTLFAVLWPGPWPYVHLGGWALDDALIIAWALRFPMSRIRVYGLLVIGGPPLAYGTLAVTVLIAAYVGVAPVMPELLAAITALTIMTGTHRRLWRRLRPRRYSVVDGDRHGGPYHTN